jgi:hypothetical protein
MENLLYIMIISGLVRLLVNAFAVRNPNASSDRIYVDEVDINGMTGTVIHPAEFGIRITDPGYRFETT